MFSKISLLFLFLSLAATGRDIHISPQGDDSHKGTATAPVRSVKKARELASPFYGKEPVNFLFSEGVHYLPETVVLTSSDSGTKQFPITYKGTGSGKTVLSGGKRLSLNWELYKDDIYRARIEEDGLLIDQLYINGTRQRMARFPNAVENKNVFDAWELNHNAPYTEENDALHSGRVSRWAHPEGAYIHAMHNALWGDMHWIVTGKNEKGELIYEGGWQNNRPSPMHKTYRFVENVFEELDVPGEWFHDRKEGWLYYYPLKGEKIETALVEVVLLKHLVELNGTKERPVRYVQFENLVFRHSARTFMENKEQLLRSDWTTYRGGAVTINGARNCTIRNCEFDQLGGNAVFVNNYNRNILVSGCNIHESGANGVAFVGDPDSVRSPLFRYGNQNYAALDLENGAKSDNYPAECRVEDCLITRTGRFEKQTAPVQISISHKITVSHCSIYDVPRAGININEGTFGGHIIEFCDVFNTVLETGDHGSFNSWGRDRFWTPDINTTSREVEKNPKLPFLDILDPVVIRNNRWRCDHGWDIDLDDGSSRYRIHNNLLLSGGLKLREGYDRIVTNNIVVNNSLHPHVWYKNSGDVIKSNIFFEAYKPIGMNVCIPQNEKWGKEIDHNFFSSGEHDRDKFKAQGCDTHSLFGNPLFIDPAKGDFRVMNSSPVLKTGFKNFPMDQFGVVSPQLKALAKQPAIPGVSQGVVQEQSSETVWHEAEIKNITSLGEQSAAGLKDRNGVLISNVAAKSVLEKAGLKNNDVIIEVRGTKIRSVDELKKLEKLQPLKGSVPFVIWRNQQSLSINIPFP